MNSHNENPFETIESAHEFVKLLAKAVREAKRELRPTWRENPRRTNPAV